MAAASFVLALSCALPFVGEADDDTVTLTFALRAPRREYLLGEVVVLAGALRNTGKQPVSERRADLSEVNHALDVFLSKDGVQFAPFDPRMRGDTDHPVETLGPAKEWHFRVPLLYAYLPRLPVGLDRPGTYFVKIDYPLLSRCRGGRRPVVESNVVSFHVKAPQGIEENVWSQINRPEFLSFLHGGHAGDAEAQVVPKVLEILRAFPGSGYDTALRHALANQYWLDLFRRPPNPARTARVEEMRKVLGLPDPRAPLFPEDGRLDLPTGLETRTSLPWDEACRRILAQSGVALRAAPERRTSRISGEPNESLRQFMRRVGSYRSRWVAEADGGYRLIASPLPLQ